MGNIFLTMAYLWAWITKDVRHGLQDAFRGDRRTSLEVETTDNIRYEYKRLFHVTL